ncbi:MarR family transcriptional regulator [Halosimplex aquaticum]|uniref:MarR family transcriptional regulator n=1 Tax=Halosimplex aquaticum TaxID=3026162 RepID=A0ABD5Y1C6_9EURY|nr:MarR family transcriptional regulator [Halosimplex aquaticum]
MRQPADWMQPMDERILEALQSCGLVLSPSIIAYNIDKSREAVGRRLSELSDFGLVERVDRGKYIITTEGEDYLNGDLNASELEKKP